MMEPWKQDGQPLTEPTDLEHLQDYHPTIQDFHVYQLLTVTSYI